MKKTILMILVLALALCMNLTAASVSIGGHSLNSGGTYLGDKGLGIGIYLGRTAALSVKTWVNRNDALQFDAGWDFNGGYIGLGAAYLIHNFDIIKVEGNKVPLYLGIKGYAGLWSGGADIGVQIPLGIDWIFRTAPIDIFLQIEPGIQIVPSTTPAWNGGIGIRYWLN
jgi:hypothetical protein